MRSAKFLAPAALTLLMAACASHKTAEQAVAPATPPQPAATANSGAANTTEGAETSPGSSNGSGINAQTMPNAGSSNGNASADNSANGGGNNAGSGSAAGGLADRSFYFDYDSSDLHSDGLADLKAHAAYLAQHPDARVNVEGNCDERGTREFNMALGEHRANAVAAFLVSNGAANSQLTVISYGKEKPVDDGHDEASWSKNRRVELNYTAGQP